MASMLTQSVRSRWFAILVHAGLWLLLILCVLKLGGKRPPYQELTSASAPASSPIPVGRLSHLFNPTNWPMANTITNATNPFFTRQFVPPPTPAPPPPPTTRKLDLVYRGYFQTADRGQYVLILVADQAQFLRVGDAIGTNAFLAQVSMQSVTLTNTSGQTNLLPLNVKSQIEVPIK